MTEIGLPVAAQQQAGSLPYLPEALPREKDDAGLGRKWARHAVPLEAGIARQDSCNHGRLFHRQVYRVLVHDVHDLSGGLFVGLEKGRPGLADSETDLVDGIFDRDGVGDYEQP